MGGIIETRGFAALVGVLLGCSGCALFEQPEILDLAKNPALYRPSEFEAPRSAPAKVYVARVVDERKLPDLTKGASYKQLYSDNDWSRQPPLMLEDLLVDSILRSKIYAGISSGSGAVPAPEDVVIKPTLLEMYRMREALVGAGTTGLRRTVAVTALRVRVEGPEDRYGKREVLLDEIFQDAVATPPGLARPSDGLVLQGRAVENIMRRLLQKVYQSNSVAAASAGKSGGQPKGGAGTRQDAGVRREGSGREK